jgi:SOS-response transcriptional repressor LexA
MRFFDWLVKVNNGKITNAQKNFSEKVGTGIYNVSHWVSGRTSPNLDMRKKISKVYNISLENLDKIFEETKQKSRHLHDNMTRDYGYSTTNLLHVKNNLSVIGVVSSEFFTCSFDDSAEPFEVLPLSVQSSNGKNAFALKIMGDHLEPLAKNGWYAFIVPSSHVPDGQIALICINSEYTLKRIFRRKDHVELSSDNPKLRPLKLHIDEIDVIGRVAMFGIKPE